MQELYNVVIFKELFAAANALSDHCSIKSKVSQQNETSRVKAWIEQYKG